MKNICFVINQFNIVGGRQKTANKIINLCSKIYNVFLINDDKLFIDNDINYIYIQNYLKKNNIDLIILMSSFSSLDIWIRILKNTNIPAIYSEHCSPQYTIKRWNIYKRHELIKLSSCVRVHFESYKKYIYDQNKCWVIPNYINYHNNISTKKNIILYVGRLVNDPKNISFIINAFNKVNINWEFKIYGQNIDNIKIDYNNVRYMGIEKDITKIYNDASLLVNASSSEGFGNSILEALSFDIPILAIDDKHYGISQLINNTNGIKCKDKNIFSIELQNILHNSNILEKFNNKCKNSIEKYYEDSNKWIEMISSLI